MKLLSVLDGDFESSGFLSDLALKQRERKLLLFNSLVRLRLLCYQLSDDLLETLFVLFSLLLFSVGLVLKVPDLAVQVLDLDLQVLVIQLASVLFLDFLLQGEYLLSKRL